MPQLNRDILREVFYEIIEENGIYENIDKFMMAGKEPFKLVLDICKKSNDVKINGFGNSYNTISARLPYTTNRKTKTYKPSKYFASSLLLFKPISIALASSLTSLKISCCFPELLPMLKSVSQELQQAYICDWKNYLKLILDACVSIPNVKDGVTLECISLYNFSDVMISFAIPCQKLKIKGVYFNNILKCMNLQNSHLKNIRDLKIHGVFDKTDKFNEEVKEFAAFLSINFPNLETLNVNFFVKYNPLPVDYYWNWNEDGEIANFFKVLPSGVKGSISFKIFKSKKDNNHLTEYPDIQKNADGEYYKSLPITDTLSFKMKY